MGCAIGMSSSCIGTPIKAHTDFFMAASEESSVASTPVISKHISSQILSNLLQLKSCNISILLEDLKGGGGKLTPHIEILGFKLLLLYRLSKALVQMLFFVNNLLTIIRCCHN